MCIVQDEIAGNPVLQASIKMSLPQIRIECERIIQRTPLTVLDGQTLSEVHAMEADFLQRILAADCLVDRFPLTRHSTSRQRFVPFMSYARAIQNTWITNFLQSTPV